MSRWIVAAVAVIVALGIYYRWRILQVPGVRITSWWRTPWKNKAVGGVPNSRHQLGLAFDVVPGGRVTRDKLAGIGFRKVIDEGDHVHVEIV